MNKTFTALAQANVDHYNEYPITHTVIAVVGLVAALVVANKMAQQIAKNDLASKGIIVH